MNRTAFAQLINRYKSDPESVYNTWFVSSAERMKAFGAIRRGVKDAVQSISAGTFGNDFKGSPLEVVLTAVTEQKQVFEGAAHPFYWKPKLRIPDIYENEANKRAFGSFLDACLNAGTASQILSEISRLAAAQIKGLGPACANIIYFLHPTLIPPSNTAMVNGFNALFGGKKKLGSWENYLEMREAIVQANAEARDLLSKDLGAIAGLLFEIGSGRMLIEANADDVLQFEREKAERVARQRHAQVLAEQHEESEHTLIQYLLIKVGRAFNYDVYVARNDRHRSCKDEAFSLLTTPSLPQQGWPEEVMHTVSLIDVIWLSREANEIVCAFEVEKSTSIYSGILRLEDLARSIPDCICQFYLLAPATRQKEVMAQLVRPAFRYSQACASLDLITFEALSEHCEALCRFGDDYRILQKIVSSRPG